MELTADEQRVLGCLLEKQRTTPDAYPLSLNALRLACNQSTNRDPVMELGDEQVREACQGLYRHGLARLASSAGSRTIKYRHLASEQLQAGDAELALLAVLLLRGPQTAGELRSRSERLHHFGSVDEVLATLDAMARRGLTELLAREPGRKEPRHRHLLGAAAPGHVAPAAAHADPVPTAAGDLADRVAALEARIAALEAKLAG